VAELLAHSTICQSPAISSGVTTSGTAPLSIGVETRLLNVVMIEDQMSARTFLTRWTVEFPTKHLAQAQKRLPYDG